MQQGALFLVFSSGSGPGSKEKLADSTWVISRARQRWTGLLGTVPIQSARPGLAASLNARFSFLPLTRGVMNRFVAHIYQQQATISMTQAVLQGP